MNSKVKLIYLLGAGRSGTTLLATVLNTHDKIISTGEMHQFKEHLNGLKTCSCGKKLNQCDFWKEVTIDFGNEIAEELDYCERMEKHKNIPLLLLTNKKDKRYLKTQERIFQKILKDKENISILDSSKYISRYLLLSKSKKFNVKGVYVVRDVRGVINSFQKKVQTPKNPISTILYYSLINLFGQIVCWLDSKVIKVKYEDFVQDPINQLSVIYQHSLNGNDNVVTLPEELQIPHIIGGNRMKHKKKINIIPDYKWKQKISRKRQIIYYLAIWPLMVLNGYRI